MSQHLVIPVVYHCCSNYCAHCHIWYICMWFIQLCPLLVSDPEGPHLGFAKGSHSSISISWAPIIGYTVRHAERDVKFSSINNCNCHSCPCHRFHHYAYYAYCPLDTFVKISGIPNSLYRTV